MPPRSSQGPRRARRRRARVYKVAGVLDLVESGVLDTQESIERLAKRAQDPATILVAAPLVYEAEKRLFAADGSGQWKDPKPATIERRKYADRRAPGGRLIGKPLRATGALEASLTDPKAKGAVAPKTLRRATQLDIGTKLVQGVMQARAGRNPISVDQRGRDEVVEAIRKKLLTD